MQRSREISSTWRTTLSIGLIATMMAACGGNGDDGSSSADDAQQSTSETVVESVATNPEQAGTTPATDPSPEASDCPSDPFDGTVERADDSDGPGHTAGMWTGPDFAETDVAKFGDNDFTIYLSDQPIEGFTVTAPSGGVVVTIFIRGGETALEPGRVFTVDEERDEFGFIVDNSGNAASSNTVGGVGTLTVISASDTNVCFTVDYTDPFRTVSGTVSATAN